MNSKKSRINLNLPLKKEKVAEDDDTERHIREGRQFEIKAAIVRIMKARKRLTHQELIEEVIETLSHRFVPEVSAIKVRIQFVR